MACSLCKEINQPYNEKMRYTDDDGNYTRAGKTNCVARVMFLILFIIGFMAAANKISGRAGGWIAAALGAGIIFMQFAGGNLKERRIDVFATTMLVANIVTMGVLGGIGKIPGAQVGQLMIIITITALLIYCCCCCIPMEIQRRRIYSEIEDSHL